MFEGDQEIFVELLLLATGLMLEGLALGDGIVLLGVAWGDLLAVNAAFENFHSRRIFGGNFGQGNQLLGQVGDEGGLDEGGLDQLLEDRGGDFEVLVAYGDVTRKLEVFDGTSTAFFGRHHEPIVSGLFAH